jgi:hypothetical protein
MKKIIGLLAVTFIFFILPQPAQATQIAGGSAVLKNQFEKADNRTEQLQAYLNNHHSPLASEADTMIKAADQYGLDWKLIPAITGVESTFGKNIPFNSFNAYGWSNGAYRFESWEQSINHVAKFLKEKYVNRGLDTPEKIAPVYAPPSPSWGWKVRFFMNKIENFGNFEGLEALNLTI